MKKVFLIVGLFLVGCAPDLKYPGNLTFKCESSLRDVVLFENEETMDVFIDDVSYYETDDEYILRSVHFTYIDRHKNKEVLEAIDYQGLEDLRRHHIVNYQLKDDVSLSEEDDVIVVKRINENEPRKRGWRGLILRDEDSILNLLSFMNDACEVVDN